MIANIKRYAMRNIKLKPMAQQTAMQNLIDYKIKLILSARFIDITIRKDGEKYVFEGDFIKKIIYESKYYNETYKKE